MSKTKMVLSVLFLGLVVAMAIAFGLITVSISSLIGIFVVIAITAAVVSRI